MISIKSLHKFFNKGRQNENHVINDINLLLPEKGMVAIFGKSGCGKTTLLNTIGGLDKYNSGDIFVKGENIARNTDTIRNKYMGYIFQNYNLNKEETCFENIANALYLCGITDKKIVEERVSSALKNVGMEKYSKRTPDTLSGGQQQRIAIARAIVKNPPIILADEPTGNLDEANAVMIMDLLKEISREHLVLLVTHEANLVDYYCDKVIELSDGKVINVKENINADGYYKKDKNTIYLGELEKNVISYDKFSVEYYGDAPNVPVKFKIINNGGKIFLKIENEDVNLISPTSEIKIKEGVFKEKNLLAEKQQSLQMASLPPISGSNFGKLFSFKKSVKKGYATISKKQKKGKKLLKMCMGLFAAVLVFMSSIFGTAFADIFKTKESYNNNVFYVYTKNAKESKKLNDALNDSKSGIDYVKLFDGYPNGDSNFVFYSGLFETYQPSMFSNDLMANAVILDMDLTKNLPLVAGKKTDLKENEAVITTKVADIILEKSTVGYIKEYNDLLGLISRMISINGKNIIISGIVESEETSLYLSSIGIARNYLKNSRLSVMLDADFHVSVNEGEGIAVIFNKGENIDTSSLKDTVKINGRSIKLSKVYSKKDYNVYLTDEKISKKGKQAFFEDLMEKNYPHIVKGTEKYNNTLEKLYAEKYGEYILYFYSEYDSYLREMYISDPSSFELWMYVNKNINIALNSISNDLYFVVEFKNKHGVTPTLEQVREGSLENEKEMEKYYEMYSNEFYNSTNLNYFSNILFVVDEKDYIAFSKELGETDTIALNGDFYYDKLEKEIVVEEITSSVFVENCYTVVHSDNVEKTKKWLEEQFPNFSSTGNYPELITPDGIFQRKIEENKDEIVGSIITMCVFLAFMSVCMYFIMRSSLMGKIKEVGIYRAIGVTKKNLTFRFMIESMVLAMFTVVIGFLFASGFIYAGMALSPILETIFFYPFWYAGIVLTILFGLCILFGTVPIRSLLRQTPSAILAKFDI